MAVLTVTLTEDILKLVSRISFKDFPSDRSSWEVQEKLSWGIDFNSLYGGSYVFEDISYILGVYDKHIEGTECDPMGVQFPKELEDYMWEIHGYVVDHIQEIEELVHQFVNRGGLTPGVYKAKSNERIWEKVSGLTNVPLKPICDQITEMLCLNKPFKVSACINEVGELVGWNIVNCDEDGNIVPVTEIAKSIKDLFELKEKLK